VRRQGLFLSESTIDLQRARDHFMRASAALTETPDPHTIAFALLEAGLGILSLAKADRNERALNEAENYLRRLRDERSAP
jgi:hypothetical protein